MCKNGVLIICYTLRNLLVDWKTGRLINLALAARTYTLNAVRYTLEKVLNFGFLFCAPCIYFARYTTVTPIPPSFVFPVLNDLI